MKSMVAEPLWCVLLFLNEEKYKIIYLGSKDQLINKNEYFINDIKVSDTIVEKDLGVLITSELDWEKLIIRNCSNATFAAQSIFNNFTLKLLRILNSYIKHSFVRNWSMPT